MFRRFRKLPIEVSAIQWTDNNIQSVDAFFGDDFHDWEPLGSGAIEIRTLEGLMRVEVGDWIIRGIEGEFYPCKPDIFEATYEEIFPDQDSPVEIPLTEDAGDLLEDAWGIIANAYGGNWDMAPVSWRTAAERFRDGYGALMGPTDDQIDQETS